MAPPSPSARLWRTRALIFAALYWIFDLGALRAGVPDVLDDTWEYGVVARALLAGHGFRTDVIHPPLWLLRDAAGTVPVLIHGPILPLLLAPLLALMGPRALDHVAILAALFAWLTLIPLFRIASRFFGPAVAATACLVWTVSPLTLRAVHHDPSLPLGALLLMVTLDRLARPEPRALSGGLALGAATLVRPEFLPAALLLPFIPRRRLRAVFGFVVYAAPWWFHNAKATGSPFFNLSSYLTIGYWTGHPGLSVLRDFALPPTRWPKVLAAAWPHLSAKWIDFFPHALKRALLAPTGGTGWLVVVGVFAALRDARTRGFGVVAIALAAIPLAVMTATLYDPRYLTPFLPLWALAAALGAPTLARALPAWGRKPRTWIGLLALMAIPSVGPALREAAADGQRLERRLAEERALLDRSGIGHADRAARDPVFSDTPDFVAWSAGRPTVWMTREEYDALSPCTAFLPAPLDADRPCRSHGDDLWFHASGGR